METGAAGDSRNECAAKTMKNSGTVLVTTLFCAQSSQLVDCCKSQPEKKCILCWCDCDPQLQNINSCTVGTCSISRGSWG